MLRETYFKLLDRIFNASLMIRTESAQIFPNRKAWYERRDDGESVIHVIRATGGAWLTGGSLHTERVELANGARDLLEEICLLAHELGHHHSTFEGYEEIRDRLEVDLNNATHDEKQAIYDEEVFAWASARGLLPTLGFTEMARFEEIAASHLATYKEMWSASIATR